MNNPDQTLRGLITPILSMPDVDQFLFVRNIREQRLIRPPAPEKTTKPKATRKSPAKTPKHLEAFALALLNLSPEARNKILSANYPKES